MSDGYRGEKPGKRCRMAKAMAVATGPLWRTARSLTEDGRARRDLDDDRHSQATASRWMPPATAKPSSSQQGENLRPPKGLGPRHRIVGAATLDPSTCRCRIRPRLRRREPAARPDRRQAQHGLGESSDDETVGVVPGAKAGSPAPKNAATDTPEPRHAHPVGMAGRPNSGTRRTAGRSGSHQDEAAARA